MFYSTNIFGYIILSFIPAIFLITANFIKKTIKNQTPFNIDHNIEGLRGLACLLVFINHSVWIMQHNHLENSTINYNNFLFSGNSGSFGVELFFCITGFLFSKKIKKGEFDFLFYKKRIKRLAPAYLVVSSFVLMLFFIENHQTINYNFDLISLIPNIYGFGFFGSGINLPGFSDSSLNIVTWTLPYEWKFYAIIPFISVLFMNFKSRVFIGIFGLSVIFIDVYSGTILWVYFISGFLCSYINPTSNKKIKAICLIPILVIFYACIFLKIESYGIGKAVLVSLFFSLCILSRPKFISFGLLSIIGTVSYSIYLIHQPVMNIVSRTSKYLIDTSTLPETGLIAISLISAIITMILSVGCYKYVEKRFM